MGWSRPMAYLNTLLLPYSVSNGQATNIACRLETLVSLSSHGLAVALGRRSNLHRPSLSRVHHLDLPILEEADDVTRVDKPVMLIELQVEL